MERDDTILEFSALTTVHLAHNLQNLLSIMSRCADSLGDRSHGRSAQEQRDLRHLNAAIDAAFRLSRDLLAAVGLQQPSEPLVIDVNELIVRCRGMLKRLTGDAIQLVIKAEAPDLVVEAAPVQLEWILMNLAANGRDAMPDGGVLHIETESVERWIGATDDISRPSHYVCLTVRDEGHGVADHTRTSLFEPFFTTKALGAGLGLTSVALTARLLKGWLYVDSLKAGGTSVHVLLPRYAGTTPGDAPG